MLLLIQVETQTNIEPLIYLVDFHMNSLYTYTLTSLSTIGIKDMCSIPIQP